jgi:hypothetical protein
MAAAAVTIAVSILGDIVAAIPAGEALWNAIVQLRTQNPGMTQAQADALMLAMTQTIATVGADELATLALIPANPPKTGA